LVAKFAKQWGKSCETFNDIGQFAKQIGLLYKAIQEIRMDFAETPPSLEKFSKGGDKGRTGASTNFRQLPHYHQPYHNAHEKPSKHFQKLSHAHPHPNNTPLLAKRAIALSLSSIASASYTDTLSSDTSGSSNSRSARCFASSSSSASTTAHQRYSTKYLVIFTSPASCSLFSISTYLPAFL